MSKVEDENIIDLVRITPITDGVVASTVEVTSSRGTNEVEDTASKWPRRWRPYAALVSGFLMMAYTW